MSSTKDCETNARANRRLVLQLIKEEYGDMDLLFKSKRLNTNLTNEYDYNNILQ